MEQSKKVAITVLVTALVVLGIVIAYVYVSARVPNNGVYGNQYPYTNYGPNNNIGQYPYNYGSNNGYGSYGNAAPYNGYGPYGSYGEPYSYSGPYNGYGQYGGYGYPYGSGMMGGMMSGFRGMK